MRLAYTIGHVFLPRTSNNHKAKILHSSGLFVLLALFLTFQLALQFLSRPEVGVLGYAANISTDKVIELTNGKRQEEGLATLQYDAELAEAAKQKGEDMLEYDYWAHVSPTGVEPWHFFVNVGYKYRYAGENLARDFSNPQAAVDAWMASTSHRENMLSPKYTDIGVAVVEGDLGGVEATIIVQLFGTRAGDTPPVVPVAAAQTLGSSPTPLPTPTVQPVAAVSSFQDQSTEQTVNTPFNVARFMSFVTVVTLTAVFLVDYIIIKRKNVVRVGSKVFAHLSFLGMIIAILLIIRAGSIL